MSLINEDRYTIARRNLDESYAETQRTAQNTLNIGRDTLTELQLQDEKLQTAEDTLEASDYTMERSLKVLRGMTWSGMFYNAVTLQSGNDPVSKQVPKEGQSSYPSSSSAKKSSTDLYHNQSTQSSAQALSHDDEQIMQLSKAVDEIYRISVATGEALDNQKTNIDRIQTKTEIVIDKTLEATLKASRITSRKASSSYIGRFQFIDLQTSHFLCIRDDDHLHLTNRSDRSTMFDLYIKEDNVLGIQSVKTILFLGSTVLGSVKVSGEYFGRYEECYVNLGGRPTGILLLSKNWGGGGWLKYPRDGDRDELICEVTSSIHDKEKMIIFHAQPIEVDNNNKKT